MSIAKIIHYCWFGGNPLPNSAKKCIKSWKKYCPDYKIIEWNENNFDIQSCPLYVRQAYEAKKWAFVTDYVRLKIVYENGGIYLDTDVELIKSLDELLKYDAYFGFEAGKYVATGLGFGAIPKYDLVKDVMDDYNDVSFILPNGEYNLLACPKRNTEVFLKYGLVANDCFQKINNCVFLPSEWLCPLEYETGRMTITKNTVSIHHFSASWCSTEIKKKHRDELKRIKRVDRIHAIKHLPNFVINKLLGNSLYEKLKRKIKK